MISPEDVDSGDMGTNPATALIGRIGWGAIGVGVVARLVGCGVLSGLPLGEFADWFE